MMFLAMAYVLALGQTHPSDGEAVRRAITLNQSASAPAELTALGPEAVPWMIRALPKIASPMLFREVADELRRRKAMATIPALIQCLGAVELGASIQRAAGEALRGWGWTAVDDLIRGTRRANHDLATSCAEILADLSHFRPADRRMKPMFLGWSHRVDREFRVAAAHGLWNLAQWTQQWSMDGVYVIHVLDRDCLRRVIELSQDQDGGVRGASLSRLSLILWSKDRKLPVSYLDRWESPIFEEYEKGALTLLKDKDPIVRAAAVAAVDARGYLDGSNYGALLDVDELVRHTGMVTAKIVGDGYVSSLALLAKSPRPEVRLSAARLLGRSRQPSAVPTLMGLLKDAEPEVARAAREALKLIRGDHYRSVK